MTISLLLTLAAAPVQDTAPPRLVVLVSIDQLIPAQLERLEPSLDRGLGRLWREGLVFSEARLGYAVTETGPGHATFATGCLPRTHGVTGNTFFDRGTRASRYCVGDDTRSPVPATAAGGQISAAPLRVATLGDRLRAHDPRAKVFSVAGKDRAAVCMGGRHAAPALWWDRSNGGFASSTAYGDVLPEFVVTWNTTWAEAAAGWTWAWSDARKPEELGAAPDERAGEAPFHGQGVTLPYELAAEGSALPGQVFGTPLCDRFTCEVATLAVDALGLGADDAPDLLALGLSGCDVLGHGFGPYSHEVTDLLLRTDDALGVLFAHLDARVGEGRWLAALSADHGVLPLPEFVEGGRRVTTEERSAAQHTIREALEAELGDAAPRLRSFGTSFNLEGAVPDPRAARALAAEVAATAEWVAAAYTYDQLSGAAPAPAGDPYWASYLAGFDAERCPDVVVRLSPATITRARGTTHGSPYEYDQRVPLILLGPAFPAEHRGTPVTSADAVPSLLKALGLAARGLDGRDVVGG